MSFRQGCDFWRQRYGKVNEHNAQIPCDTWLEDWEKQAILEFHDKHLRDGYRQLTFMMLDDDVVAVSPSSVYRVLKQARCLDRHSWAPSKKARDSSSRPATVRPRPFATPKTVQL